MKYIEFRKGLSHKHEKRNTVIPLSELPQHLDPQEDCYRSLFFYDQKFADYVKEKGTVSGYRGKAGIDRLVFDFDNNDLEVARQDSLKLINKLKKEYNVQESEIGIFFSGRKGFALELRTDNIEGIHNEFNENIPYVVKRLCLKLAQELESFDRVIYNHNRLYRIVGSIHQKASTVDNHEIHLFKTSLPLKMLQDSSIKEIQKYCIQMRVPVEFNSIADTTKLSELAKKVIKDIKNAVRQSTVTGIAMNSEGLPDSAKCPRGQKVCMWRLCQGTVTQYRDSSLLRIAVHEKKQGMPLEVIVGKLRGVLDKMDAADPEKAKLDPMNDYDLERIAKQALSNDYDFGCNDSILSEICDNSCYLSRSKTRDKRVVSIADSYRRSKPFYREYFSNIVPTGLKGLDTEMPLFKGTFNLIVGKPGCHPKGTKVIMHNGSLKNVEDVQVGDQLMGPDSSIRTVKQLCRNHQEMVEILPNKGTSFVVNLDHELSLVNTDTGATTLISLRNYFLKSKTFKQRHKLYRVGVEFDSTYYKDLSIDPYVLGCWLGDGESSSNRIWTQDVEVLEELQNYSKKVGLEVRKSESGSKSSGKASCYVVASKTSKKNTNCFLQELRHLDLIRNKHIPEKYLISSKENRLQLLAGLIDTDGYLAKSKKGKKHYGSFYEYVTKSDQLAQGVLFLARSLGLAAYDYKTLKYARFADGTKSKTGAYHRISISGDTHLIPVKIPRKKANPRLQKKNVLRTGFTARLLPVDNYYGFTLDKDHLYLLEDFTVTKNTGKTSLMLNILDNASRAGTKALFFSMDMAEEMLVQRFAPILLRDDKGRPKWSGKDFMIAHARHNEELMREAEAIFDSLSDNVLIDYNTQVSVESIRDEIKAQEVLEGRKPQLVIVDYVQLLHSEKEGYARHTENAVAITNLAKETGVCILGLSQTPRGGKDAEVLAKGSGAWEEKASTQINCWRPFGQTHPDHDFTMSIKMVKNRLGPSKRVDVYWHGPSGIIRNLMEEEEMQLEALRHHLDHD